MVDKKKDPTSTNETVARFQLESERLIAEVRREAINEISRLERKVAQLEDSVARQSVAMAEMRTLASDAIDNARRCVNDVTAQLKQTFALADEARQSAAVYEKLRESQPDFVEQVRELQRELGREAHKVAVLTEQYNALRGDLDRAKILQADLALEHAPPARLSASGGLVQVD